MNGDNGQHKSNALLKQILEISQHTLEAQNMQLKVLEIFDQKLEKLVEGQQQTNQKLDRFIDISERNFKQTDENFKFISVS